MIDTSQLPHLLRLVDDPSPVVRKSVAEALASFGEGLDAALDELDPPPSADSVQAALVAAERARTSAESDDGDLSAEADDDASGAARKPSRAPRFEVGQLVSHKRYGYRGIVVAVDEECRADEAWYGANRTKPSRDQPWYHVLVHDSDQVTYAAQTSLDADPSSAELRHPLLEQFFDVVGDGVYLRNSRRWPGWDRRAS